MSASIAFLATAVRALPSNGRITSALTFLAISVSMDEICRVTSLVASTGSNLTSEYRLACASAFLLIAAIQPWSPCGPEKPIVTVLPGLVLSLLPAATWAPVDGVLGVLLVQPTSSAPPPIAAPPAGNRRRSRPGERSSVMNAPSGQRGVGAGDPASEVPARVRRVG